MIEFSVIESKLQSSYKSPRKAQIFSQKVQGQWITCLYLLLLLWTSVSSPTLCPTRKTKSSSSRESSGHCLIQIPHHCFLQCRTWELQMLGTFSISHSIFDVQLLLGPMARPCDSCVSGLCLLYLWIPRWISTPYIRWTQLFLHEHNQLIITSGYCSSFYFFNQSF